MEHLLLYLVRTIVSISIKMSKSKISKAPVEFRVKKDNAIQPVLKMLVSAQFRLQRIVQGQYSL